MACDVLTPPITRALVATTSATVRFEPLTDWMPAIGVDTIRALVMISASTSGFRVKLAIQTATVRPDNPSSWVALGSDIYAVGGGNTQVRTDRITVTTQTGPAMYVRFGVQFFSAAAGYERGDVALQIATDPCAELIGSKTFQLVANLSSTYYEPVSGWFPAMWM